MAISIGAVTLSDDLMWINRFNVASVGQSSRNKINGSRVVQSSPLLKIPEIELGSISVGGGFSGYFTLTQIQAIKEYERTQAQVTFVYESFSTTVVIKVNGINVTPVIQRPNTASEDWFTGSVTMLEI